MTSGRPDFQIGPSQEDGSTALVMATLAKTSLCENGRYDKHAKANINNHRQVSKRIKDEVLSDKME